MPRVINLAMDIRVLRHKARLKNDKKLLAMWHGYNWRHGQRGFLPMKNNMINEEKMKIFEI